MKHDRTVRRGSRNAPCPCGCGRKTKHCAQLLGDLEIPPGWDVDVVRVTPEQAGEIEVLMRTVNELQRQGHRIQSHECPICEYLEQQGLKDSA